MTDEHGIFLSCPHKAFVLVPFMLCTDPSDSLISRSTRTLSHTSVDGRRLKPVLGFLDVLSFGISATIGSGIFVSIGYIAKFLSGPALFISFISVIVSALLSAVCYAEFSSKVSSSGMGYSYKYTTYGELVAFCTGLITFISYCLGTAAVSRGWAGYLRCLINASFGYEIPDILVAYPVNDWISISLLAPLLCGFSAIIAIAGMKESAAVGRGLLLINLGIMTLLIWYGIGVYGDTANLSPLTLPDKGWTGVLQGSGLAFFCLIGWDLTCSLTEEVKDANRTLPRGIVTTLLLVGTLYCAVSITLCAMMPTDLIDVSAPVASAFLAHGDHLMYLLVSVAAVTITKANVLTGSTGPPRVIFTMAKDGLLPEALARVDSVTGVPRHATLLCGFLNVMASGLFDFKQLASFTSCLALLVYTVVCGGVLLLRCPSRGSRGSISGSLAMFVIASLCFQFNLLSPAATSVSLVKYGIVNLVSAVALAIAFRQGGRTPRVLKGLSSGPLLQSEDSPVLQGFRCPWVPIVPMAAVWVNTLMIASLGLNTLGAGAGVVVIGGLIYAVYGAGHSRLNTGPFIST